MDLAKLYPEIPRTDNADMKIYIGDISNEGRSDSIHGQPIDYKLGVLS